jgi:hypothetical protein
MNVLRCHRALRINFTKYADGCGDDRSITISITDTPRIVKACLNKYRDDTLHHQSNMRLLWIGFISCTSNIVIGTALKADCSTNRSDATKQMVTHLRPEGHESFAGCYYPVMTPLKSVINLEFLGFRSLSGYFLALPQKIHNFSR